MSGRVLKWLPGLAGALATGLVSAPVASSLPIAEAVVGDFYRPLMPLLDVAAGAVMRSEPAYPAMSVR
ncbi:hypothetical protein [Nocardia salmonicida]|uniref:hypothetical protein n=1 Tax=Nocardia salmonicida TaxID=53431 RepID=UPI0033E5AA90